MLCCLSQPKLIRFRRSWNKIITQHEHFSLFTLITTHVYYSNRKLRQLCPMPGQGHINKTPLFAPLLLATATVPQTLPTLGPTSPSERQHMRFSSSSLFLVTQTNMPKSGVPVPMLTVGMMIGPMIQEFSEFTRRNSKKRGWYTKKVGAFKKKKTRIFSSGIYTVTKSLFSSWKTFTMGQN